MCKKMSMGIILLIQMSPLFADAVTTINQTTGSINSSVVVNQTVDSDSYIGTTATANITQGDVSDGDINISQFDTADSIVTIFAQRGSNQTSNIEQINTVGASAGTSQDGSGSTSEIKQIGDTSAINVVTNVTQIGDSHNATSLQSGENTGSTINVVQYDTGHLIDIKQDGTINNNAQTLQSGSSNEAYVEQVQAGHTGTSDLTLTQAGAANIANIHQNATRHLSSVSLDITQTGEHNRVDIGQDGNYVGSSFAITQEGTGNFLSGDSRYSINPAMSVNQTGSDNTVFSDQYHAENSIMNIDVVGNVNFANAKQSASTNDQTLITLAGLNNSVTSIQGTGGSGYITSINNEISHNVTGNDNTASIFQEGSNHNYTATQEGNFGDVSVCQGSSSNCPAI